MSVEHTLVPVLREGVAVVKMILFKELKPYLGEKYPQRGAEFAGRLSGAVINELFGTPNPDPTFAAFAQAHRVIIHDELGLLAVRHPNLRIALTDALRIQFLCDHQENIDSSAVLSRADELGILVVEREVPLPATFMNMVRTLGNRLNLLA
ncbi:MAG: hypothetical protein LJE63_00870 [Desulfobacteraceae bacterium]|nr:hypothetical protein [Desulfobacteraceae bacterium]